MFLYKAIQEVLRQNNNVPMTIEDIAAQINRQGLYTKRDGSQADSWGVGARAANDVVWGNPPLFDVLIRLRSR